jgi:hypothetical protein
VIAPTHNEDWHHINPRPPAAAEAAQRNAAPLRLSEFSSSLGTRIADWIKAATDYYTAAAVYEQLSRLSDAELQRRGLSRATLASDVAQACDRGNL